MTAQRRKIGGRDKEGREQLLHVRPRDSREHEAPECGEVDPEEQEEGHDPPYDAHSPFDRPRAVPEDPPEEADADEVHAERCPEDPARIHGAEPADQVHEDGEDEEEVRPEKQGGRDPQESLRYRSRGPWMVAG